MSLRTGKHSPNHIYTLDGETGGRTFSRRDALKVLGGLGGAAALLASPLAAFAEPKATQETLNALASAEDKLAAAEEELDRISSNIESLSQQQAQTVEQIGEVEGQIAQTEDEIAQTQEELDRQQAQLAARVSDTYKSGDKDFLSTLLSTSTFEEFISTLFYANKVSEHDQALIEEVRTTKEKLETQKADLEAQKADLEQLNADLEAQLADMKAQKAEAENLLNSLDDEVKSLMAKRDAEILAAAEAEKAAQQQQNYPVYGNLPDVGSGVEYENAAAAQRAIVNACYAVPSPGAGWCAAWVSRVYAAAGLGSYSGNADDMYAWYCHSSNLNDLKVGMIVAVSSHPHTYAGRIYGHVGIYVGNGIIMHNIGAISSQSVDSWISYYGATVTPRWGWLGNLNLG